MPSDTTRVLLRFVETLERLSIPYAVGGSIASGAHGEPRATRVVDVLITLSREQIDTVDAQHLCLHGSLLLDAPDRTVLSLDEASLRERRLGSRCYR